MDIQEVNQWNEKAREIQELRKKQMWETDTARKALNEAMELYAKQYDVIIDDTNLEAELEAERKKVEMGLEQLKQKVTAVESGQFEREPVIIVHEVNKDKVDEYGNLKPEYVQQQEEYYRKQFQSNMTTDHQNVVVEREEETTEQPVANGGTEAVEQPVQQPTVAQPVEQPVQQPVQTQPTVQQPVAQQITQTPQFEQPVAQQITPFGQPAPNTTPFGQPVANNTLFGQPAPQQTTPFGQPVVGQPVVGQPVGQPVAQPVAQPTGQTTQPTQPTQPDVATPQKPPVSYADVQQQFEKQAQEQSMIEQEETQQQPEQPTQAPVQNSAPTPSIPGWGVPNQQPQQNAFAQQVNKNVNDQFSHLMQGQKFE